MEYEKRELPKPKKDHWLWDVLGIAPYLFFLYTVVKIWIVDILRWI